VRRANNGRRMIAVLIIFTPSNRRGDSSSGILIDAMRQSRLRGKGEEVRWMDHTPSAGLMALLWLCMVRYRTMFQPVMTGAV
jgi:hypothetical protein